MDLRILKLFKVVSILFFCTVSISFNSSDNITRTKRDEIIGILNTLLSYDSQLVVLNSKPYCLKSYNFDGQPFNKNINFGCLNPILYYTSIHSKLMTIDNNYDSLFYQTEINKVESIGLSDWRDFGLNDYNNIIIRNHKKIKNKKGRFDLSIPILNSKRDISIIGYNSQIGQGQRSSKILILKKIEHDWKVISEINQIDNYITSQLIVKEIQKDSIKELPSTLKVRHLIFK